MRIGKDMAYQFWTLVHTLTKNGFLFLFTSTKWKKEFHCTLLFSSYSFHDHEKIVPKFFKLKLVLLQLTTFHITNIIQIVFTTWCYIYICFFYLDEKMLIFSSSNYNCSHPQYPTYSQNLAPIFFLIFCFLDLYNVMLYFQQLTSMIYNNCVCLI